MADDNKPMKYMRYAIGEITLVVIGILIALQINNWNEDRMLKSSVTVYLNSLKEDIENDIRALESQKKDQLFRFHCMQQLLSYSNQPENGFEMVQIPPYTKDYEAWSRQIPDSINNEFLNQ